VPPSERFTPLRTGLLIGLLIACASVLLTACGSRKSTISLTNPHAPAVKPQPIPGVQSKASVVSPKVAGLRKLVRVPKGSGFAARIAGLDGVAITQAIPAIAGDVNRFWSGEFAKSGIGYPSPQELLVQSSPVQSPCGTTVAPADPPFTCDLGALPGEDTTFYWTVPWMQQHYDSDPGRVTLAFDMAQFWSLHVQDVFGYTAALNAGTLTKAQYAEQNACFTGLYARSLASRQLIEKGDTQPANKWFSALSSSANGITSPDVSPSQLHQAFDIGWQSGDPKSCAFGATA
jgi:predicted metalloprotease